MAASKPGKVCLSLTSRTGYRHINFRRSVSRREGRPQKGVSICHEHMSVLPVTGGGVTVNASGIVPFVQEYCCSIRVAPTRRCSSECQDNPARIPCHARGNVTRMRFQSGVPSMLKNHHLPITDQCGLAVRTQGGARRPKPHHGGLPGEHEFPSVHRKSAPPGSQSAKQNDQVVSGKPLVEESSEAEGGSR